MPLPLSNALYVAQEPRQKDCVGPRSFRRGHPGRAQSSSTHSSGGRSKLPKGSSEIDAVVKDIVWPLGEFVVSSRSKMHAQAGHILDWRHPVPRMVLTSPNMFQLVP